MKRNDGAPTRPDLLGRIAALGITDKAFCAAAQVAPTFLSKAKAGGCVGTKASTSWEKVEAALAEAEAALTKTPGQKLVDLVRAERSDESAPSSQAAAGRPRVNTAELERAIVDAEAAGTVEALQAVNSRVMSGTANGSIDANTGRTLGPLISRAQQLLEMRLKHAARLQAGEPVIVEIRYVYAENWRALVDARPFVSTAVTAVTVPEAPATPSTEGLSA